MNCDLRNQQPPRLFIPNAHGPCLRTQVVYVFPNTPGPHQPILLLRIEPFQGGVSLLVLFFKRSCLLVEFLLFHSCDRVLADKCFVSFQYRIDLCLRRSDFSVQRNRVLQHSGKRLAVLNDRILVGQQLGESFHEKGFDLVLGQGGCGTALTFLLFPVFPVAPPDDLSVCIIGVPDLLPVKTTTVAANDSAAERTSPAECPPYSDW